MRWLLVAQDGRGLGHVSRQLGLARALRRLDPNSEFLFLTYSEAAHLIAAEGFASLKMPFYKVPGNEQPQRFDVRRRIAVASAVVESLAASYQPTAIVNDTFPIGLQGEFSALLKLPCPRFLIAREVRNPQPHWRLPQSLRHFDALLMPYIKGEIDMQLPDQTNAHWVGPILIRDRRDLLSRQDARRRLRLPPDARICLVSFGGGGNSEYRRLEQWALQLAARFPQWIFAFASPPLLQDVEIELGRENAGRFTYFPMAECYAAFDAAISLTGSSAYELAHMGIPSILVPSVSRQQLEDHNAKAQRLVGQGGGFVVPGFDLQALDTAFARINDPQSLTAMKQNRAALRLPNGAERGAAVLTELARQRR